MSSLSVKRTYDKKLVVSLLTHSDIWEVLDSKIPKASFSYSHAKRSDFYLIAYLNSIPIGLGIADLDSFKNYYCHFYVLKKYRLEYAIEFSKLGLNWVWENTDIIDLYASIPKKRPSVKNFAIKLGFNLVEELPTHYRLKLNRYIYGKS